MRRIAVINQKGGVGKTTTCANLSAALTQLGRRVLVADMDPQANLSLHMGQELFSEDPSTYTVLTGETPFEAAIRPTSTPGLSIVPAHIDLSGAELELASAIGRETLLRDAIDDWERAARERTGEPPVDYLILDCPPSLGLLSVNALAAVREVLIAVQTEFFALQGMSKLVEVVQLLRRRLNPELRIRGILPCLYDSRLRLAREVLAEVRRYFPGQVFKTSIRTNVKLAEAPSHGVTIFEYDPHCTGATDHLALAAELVAQEGRGENPPVEAAPQRAEELERRLTDMARGARPPATTSPPETSKPEAAPEEDPQVRAVTFPAAPLPARAESESGPLAREALVLEPQPRRGTPPTRDDLIVLAEQSEEVNPSMAGVQAPQGAHVGLTGAQATPPLEQDTSGEPGGAIDPTCEDLADLAVAAEAPSEPALGAESAIAREAPPNTKKTPKKRSKSTTKSPQEDLEEVDLPRPAEPQNTSRWNFYNLCGEDRPRMAGRMGPRVS